MALKQQQIEKYNILIALQGELNAINDEQKYSGKLRIRHLKAAQNKAKDERNLAKLHEISKQQKEQIQKITRDIQTMRLKIKPQNQFLLDKPQILSFPGEFVVDASHQPSPQTHSSTKSFSSRESDTSSESSESNVSQPSTASAIN